MARKTTTLLATLIVFGAAPAIAELNSRPLPAPPQTKASPPPQTTCDTIQLSVYFSAYEATLSQYARRAISNAKASLQGCAINKIEAVTISEEAHTDETIANLSNNRAVAVLEALTKEGVDTPKTEFRVASASDMTPNRSNSILARRVDVTVHASAGHGL